MQLGDDLPSHILVPAIHRNRAEIREIFLRRMAGPGGPRRTPSPTSPAELAAAARLHLREKFLRAKVAVSGANFAVAETGTLVVVESEGNGRMCLTLPEVLVSVVGHREGPADLARPRPDAAAAAALLDRRADEPVHVHLVRGHPRRRPAGGARRPARQRPHPRAGRRGRPPGAALHPLLGLPQRLPGLRAGRRARLRLGLPRPDRRDPQPADEGLGVDEQTDSLPYASSLCGACFEVCPVRIDIPEVLVHLRAQGRRRPPRRRRAQGRGGGHAGGRLGVQRRPAGWRCAERPSRPRRPGAGSRGRTTLPAAAAAGRMPGPGAAGPVPATCPRRRGSRSAAGGNARRGAARERP